MIVDFASRRLRSLFMLAYLCVLMAGCANSEQEEEQSNLRSLAVYYNQYRANHRGQPPANESDFKNFIAKSSGKPNVDSVLISNRDDKPFVIKYRGDKSWLLRDLIAYEQEGRNGVRDAADAAGGYQKLSDEEFQKQMSASAAKR